MVSSWDTVLELLFNQSAQQIFKREGQLINVMWFAAFFGLYVIIMVSKSNNINKNSLHHLLLNTMCEDNSPLGFSFARQQYAIDKL